MRNHRTKDRRLPFRCGVFGGVSEFSVTLQNNRLGWIDIASDNATILTAAQEAASMANRKVSKYWKTRDGGVTPHKRASQEMAIGAA
jgi:hypothetical protein